MKKDYKDTQDNQNHQGKHGKPVKPVKPGEQSQQGKLFIIVAGLGLLASSLVIPGFLEQWRRIIVTALENSIWQEDKGLLMLAAAQVVAHNSLIMFPYVGGSLVLAHGFAFRGYNRVLGYGLPPVLLILFNYLVFQQLDYWPPLAVPVLVTAAAVLLAWRSGLGSTGLVPLALIPALIVLSINSLSVSPYLADYGLARGDLTWETVLAGKFLKGEDLLNSTTISFFLILLAMALVATELIALHRRRLKDAEDLSKFELQFQHAQFQVQELRVVQEMHSLVHDLKTPLMTVQGLNSLFQLALQDEHLIDYTHRIEGAVDNLNKMISEILYDDVRKRVSVAELITYVRAHVLVEVRGQKITFHFAENLPSLEVNLIRLARALINLIENAITATSGVREGRIEVNVESNDQGQVIFTIADNGVGIPSHLLEDIWAPSYSTKSTSSGLGLGFVKRVVENHQGVIDFESSSGRGTIVRVMIPGVKRDDQNSGD
ncbi:MAG: sensor histidine kinase [Carboxydocellales bacterium]